MAMNITPASAVPAAPASSRMPSLSGSRDEGELWPTSCGPVLDGLLGRRDGKTWLAEGVIFQILPLSEIQG